jgi:hypothetical protein
MSQSTASPGGAFELSRNPYQVNKRSTRPGSQATQRGVSGANPELRAMALPPSFCHTVMASCGINQPSVTIGWTLR